MLVKKLNHIDVLFALGVVYQHLKRREEAEEEGGGRRRESRRRKGPGLRRAFKMPPLLLTSSPATQSSPAKHKEHKSPATHKQPRYA